MTPPGLPHLRDRRVGPAGRTYDGVVVLVTGGGTGLGKSIATEFGRLGASVAVVSRDEGHRTAGVAAVEEAGGRAVGVACDIRDADAVSAAFDAVEEAFGPVDHLVNNAAGNFPVPAEDMSPNAWRTVVDIVLNGTFLCSREFARRAIASGRGGSIVDVAPPTPGPAAPGSPIRRRPRPASRTWSRRCRSSGALRHPGQRTRSRADAPRDEVAAIAAVPGKYEARTTGCRPAGSGTPGTGLGRTYLCSPTPRTSRVTPWWSTAPTGSDATRAAGLHPDTRTAGPGPFGEPVPGVDHPQGATP